jgi:hypothetical protein
MNDDKLTTLLREPFADAHMTTPLDQVVRRGRAVRTRRRRLRGLTGAVTLAGSTAAAVALLVPGGHQVPAQLAAWTVTRDSDGGITVTVNQMRDPGGLQATLRADGVPARVTFDPVRALNQPLPAGCAAPRMSGQANGELQTKILTPPAIWAYLQRQRQRIESVPVRFTYTLHGHVEHATVPRRGLLWYDKLQQLRKEGAQHITIARLGIPYTVPSSLRRPRGALYINPAAIPAGIGLSIGVDVASASSYNVGVDLVVASPRCTGS